MYNKVHLNFHSRHTFYEQASTWKSGLYEGGRGSVKNPFLHLEIRANYFELIWKDGERWERDKLGLSIQLLMSAAEKQISQVWKKIRGFTEGSKELKPSRETFFPSLFGDSEPNMSDLKSPIFVRKVKFDVRNGKAFPNSFGKFW